MEGCGLSFHVAGMKIEISKSNLMLTFSQGKRATPHLDNHKKIVFLPVFWKNPFIDEIY
jgi:hypothetical protein